jgi:hypothetical protein
MSLASTICMGAKDLHADDANSGGVAPIKPIGTTRSGLCTILLTINDDPTPSAFTVTTRQK